jgi:hypothetical protein
VVGADDARKGAARSYQERFQLWRQLVEEMVSSVSDSYETTSDDETAETA